MTDETRNALIDAVWKALDEGADESDITDEVEQAFHAYLPKEES